MGSDRQNVFGTERPSQFRFTFSHGDVATVSVTYGAGREGLASVSRGSVGGDPDPRSVEVVPFTMDQLFVAFERAEHAGLRARREQWITDGYVLWSLTTLARTPTVFDTSGPPAWSIDVFLFAQRYPGDVFRQATFNFDPGTGEVREIPRRRRGPFFGP